MANDKHTTTSSRKATTTAQALYIPDGLRKRIEADFLEQSKRIRALGKTYRLPQEVTTAIVADLKDFVFNNYQGLNLKVAGVTILGYLTSEKDWEALGDNFALSTLFRDYGLINTLVRLANLRETSPQPLHDIIDETLQRKFQICFPLHIYEWTRYVTGYNPDFENEEQLLSAQAYRYVDFLVYAALKHQANAAELLKVQPPSLVEAHLGNDEIRKIVDEVIANILAVDLNLENILGLHKHLGIEEPQDPAPAASTDDQAAASPEVEAAAKIAASTAETINRRILTLYQPNTATLARPIEAKKEGLMAAEVVAIRNLAAFKSARPLPLSQIITALADRVKLSPARVTQTLQALQIIAQDKPDDIVQLHDGNEYYVYNGRNLKGLARLALGIDNPNGEEMQQIALALELVTTLRIGHDEDHIIGYNKRTKKDIIQRYRHYTQMLFIPDMRVKLNKDNQEDTNPEFALYLNRLIPTGRRSDKIIVEDGQKQRIAAPAKHLVTLGDFELARKLFKGDAGVRFYNYLLSANHKKEPDLMAEIFDYNGQRAAARQRAETLQEEARQRAAKANTKDEADKITQEAEALASAEIKAVEENIKRHIPRDRQRLYTWLNDAVDNFLIMPFSVTDAKDGSTDGRGKPIKVISWHVFKRDN